MEPGLGLATDSVSADLGEPRLVLLERVHLSSVPCFDSFYESCEGIHKRDAKLENAELAVTIR